MNESISGIIYKTTNLINGKIYVGQTTRNDIDYFGSGIKILNAIRKYSTSAFFRETLDTAISLCELNEKEIYWIESLSSTNKLIGYNIAIGGNSSHGIKHSEEAKQKIRLGNLGKKRSDDTKKKISIAKTGKSNGREGTKLSKELKQKISNAQKERMSLDYVKEHIKKINDDRRGKSLSEEHRKKLSESHMGRIPWNKGGTHSEEAKRKIGEASKKRIPNRKGIKTSEETKQKIRESMIRMWKEKKDKVNDQ